MSESADQNRIQPVDPAHATSAMRRLFAEDSSEIRAGPKLVSRSCECCGGV